MKCVCMCDYAPPPHLIKVEGRAHVSVAQHLHEAEGGVGGRVAGEHAAAAPR